MNQEVRSQDVTGVLNYAANDNILSPASECQLQCLFAYLTSLCLSYEKTIKIAMSTLLYYRNVSRETDLVIVILIQTEFIGTLWPHTHIPL